MTEDQLPTPEQLAQRAGAMRGKIGRLAALEAENAELRAYKQAKEAQQQQGAATKASETEQELRGEVMRLSAQLQEEQGAKSGLETRLAEAERIKSDLQAERDEAIKNANESGTELGKADERNQKIREDLERVSQEKELLSQERERLEIEKNSLAEQLKGKSTGDTLALRTELEIILKAAEGKTDEKPTTELGQKAYAIVVGADSKHKQAFLALKAEAEEITAALSEGREPNGIKSPFNNALYQALITKLGETAPAQTPQGDDLSGIANAVLFGMLADITETGKIPDGLPEEAKDAAIKIKAYVDSRAAAPVAAQTASAEPVIADPAEKARATADATRQDSQALQTFSAEKAALEARIAAVEAKKTELERELANQKSTAEETLSALADDAIQRIHNAKAEAETLANQQNETLKQENAEMKKLLLKAHARVKSAKGLEDKLEETETRAAAAEKKAKAYEDGTETPPVYQTERDGLKAQIAALVKEKETLTTQRDELEQKAKKAESLASMNQGEESDQEYIRQLSKIVATLYVSYGEGKPLAPEALAALAQLGDRDADVKKYYELYGKDGNSPQVAIGAYSRARASLEEAAQHARTGRSEECLRAYSCAARQFEEAIVESIPDKKYALNAALETSKAQLALNLGPQAIAWAHLALRLSKEQSGREFEIHMALSKAYRIAGDETRRKEHFDLAQTYMPKPKA